VTDLPAHPAQSSNDGLVCADPRCATLLPADAEICDECGGIRLDPLNGMVAMLCGWAEARPVVFKLPTGRSAVIGRSTPGGPVPEVDLSRLPGSESVHRSHARIENRQDEWRLTQLGRNPLVVNGRQRVVVAPGTDAPVWPGDTLDIGGVRLQLLVRI
jgi:FHA domain